MRLLSGDLRQGALQGVMVEAVARAAEVPAAGRAPRAHAARRPRRRGRRPRSRGGTAALDDFRLELGRPLQPMLASPATDIEAALEKVQPGRRRVQARRRAHPGPPRRRRRRASSRARSTTSPRACPRSSRRRSRSTRARSCSTARRSRCARTGARTRSRSPASRFGSRRAVDELRRTTPLTASLFDVLHLDGEDLLDRPGAERVAPLAAVVPEALRVPRVVVAGRGRGRRRARGRARARPRGRDGQVARRALRGRPPRRRLAQGQAAPHARPRRARRRVGPRAPARQAEQPAPRRARPARAAS